MKSDAKGTNDPVEVVRRVFDAVVVQMRNDPDFAERMRAAITGTASRYRTGRRAPAVLDPLAVWRESPESLEGQLQELSVDQLKDIVSHYGLDPSRLALKWKNADRLISLIIEWSQARARKGNVFRPPMSQAREGDPPETILHDLHGMVEAAAADLLDSENEVSSQAVRDWAGRADVTIRARCGSSYAAVFRGKGRGLAPRDELNTKIAYIVDDLMPKIRGGHLP